MSQTAADSDLQVQIFTDFEPSPYVPADLQLSPVELLLTPIKQGSPEIVVELAPAHSSPRSMPSKAKDGLSNDEIWDDTALIQSWDDALEEYKVSAAIIQLPKESRRVLTARTSSITASRPVANESRMF